MTQRTITAALLSLLLVSPAFGDIISGKIVHQRDLGAAWTLTIKSQQKTWILTTPNAPELFPQLKNLPRVLRERNVKVEGFPKGDTWIHPTLGPVETLEVDGVLDPLRRDSIRGKLVLHGKRPHLEFSNRRVRLSRVPVRLLRGKVGKEIVVGGWYFPDRSPPSMAVTTADVRINSATYISPKDDTTKQGRALKQGDTVRVLGLGVLEKGTTKIRTPYSKHASTMSPGDTVFAKVRVGSTVGWVPAWKLEADSNADLVASAKAKERPSTNGSIGATGVLNGVEKLTEAQILQIVKDAGMGPAPGTDIDTRVENMVKEAFVEYMVEGYAEEEGADAVANLKSDLEHGADIYDDDGWGGQLVDDQYDWDEPFTDRNGDAVPRDQVGIKQLSMFTDLHGIGLTQYFFYDLRTGEHLDTSDIID